MDGVVNLNVNSSVNLKDAFQRIESNSEGLAKSNDKIDNLMERQHQDKIHIEQSLNQLLAKVQQVEHIANDASNSSNVLSGQVKDMKRLHQIDRENDGARMHELGSQVRLHGKTYSHLSRSLSLSLSLLISLYPSRVGPKMMDENNNNNNNNHHVINLLLVSFFFKKVLNLRGLGLQSTESNPNYHQK
jgi:hypothetical protein